MKEKKTTKVVDYVSFKNGHFPSEDDEVEYQHDIIYYNDFNIREIKTNIELTGHLDKKMEQEINVE